MNLLLTALLSSSVTIQLPTDAEVRGTSIQLGALAQVTSLDEELARRVREFDLGSVPAPGYSRVFQSFTLKRDLENAFPETDFEFVGQVNARVSAAVQKIGTDSVRGAALQVLKERFRGKDAQFTLTSSLGTTNVPMGRTETKLDASLKRVGTRPGLWSVPVDVVVDGAVYQTVWTTWKVELWEQRRVLVRSIARGEIITPEALETRRVKVDVHSVDGTVPAIAINGAMAKHDIVAGVPVTLRDVERPLVIRRGALINLEVKKGAITAKTVANALQDGRVGDTIRIQTQSNGRELAAIVLSKDVVQIEL